MKQIESTSNSFRIAVAIAMLLMATFLSVGTVNAQETPPATPDDAAAPGARISGARGGARFDAAGPGGGRARGGGFGAAGGAVGGFTARGPQPPAAAGEGPTCSFDVTIYDLRLAPDQIGRIDLHTLTRAAANPTAFEQALTQLGAPQPLYRANQSVRLVGDSITIGTTTPYISSSQINAQGNPINTVAYSDIGATFSIIGKVGASGIELDLNVQVSSLSPGATEISPGVKAPMFRRATMAHKGLVEAQKPFVITSVDAASLDANGKAVAYIARVTLGTPQVSN